MSEPKDSHDDLNELSGDLQQVERLLTALKPRETGINRDRVMFLAGQASCSAERGLRTRRLGRWAWPSVTLCAASIGLLLGLFIGSNRSVTDRRDLADRNVASDRSSERQANPGSTKEPDAQSQKEFAAIDGAGSTLEIADAQFPPRPDTSGSDLDPSRLPNLLSLRDRMLASRDDRSLAPAGNPATNVESPGGTEPTASYHELMRQLIHNGQNQL